MAPPTYLDPVTTSKPFLAILAVFVLMVAKVGDDFEAHIISSPMSASHVPPDIFQDLGMLVSHTFG